MVSKITAITGSVRFWVIMLSAVVAVLNGSPLLDTVQVALAAVVAIGTADSISSRIGGTK